MKFIYLPYDKEIRERLGSEKRMYFLYGFLFGLAFPVIGTLMDCYLKDLGVSWSGIIKVQRETPLLWIINLAPVILGYFSSFGGMQLDILNEKNKELVRRYEEVDNLRKSADAASQSKSEFLANMSHEIRTPMNAIIGMSYLIQKTDLSAKQKDYISKIESSSKGLLRIIDDILDFSKIEAGKLVLEETDLFLEELVAGVADTVNVKLQNKNHVELVSYVDPNIPQILRGDPLRLRQVILNLADNAVKFTDSGEIIIAAKAVKVLEYGCIIEFSVKDSGIGMTAEQLANIFKPFQQADLSTTRKYGGTGLGLAISRKIVEMYDGELMAKSEHGKGTEFYFHAFFSCSDTKIVSHVANNNNLQGINALLIDDSYSARQILSEILTSFGINVYEGASASDGFEILEQARAQGIKFSIFIIDWRMPGMDGLEFISALKGDFKEEIPAVLMVTAFGVEAVREAEKQKLISGYLMKPINPSILFDNINSILYSDNIRIQLSNKATSLIDKYYGLLAGKKILLVEDNAINRELAIELLTDVGLMVDVAENGLVAVEKVKTFHYHLVLMDIQMPEMDGLTATKVIRERLGADKLPILAMTAHALKGEHEKSIAAGMNDHITKPIDPEVLYGRICEHLNLGENLIIEENSNQGSFEVLNTQMGLRRLANKKEVYYKLLEKFTQTYGNFASQLIEQLRNDNMDTIYASVHAFMGVCGNIGADKLFETTKDLNNLIRGKAEKEVIESLIRKLEKDLVETIDLIRELSIKELNTDLENVKVKLILKEALNEIKVFAELYNPKAGSLCEEILKHGVLSEVEYTTVKSINDELDNFNFDKAIVIINNYQNGNN